MSVDQLKETTLVEHSVKRVIVIGCDWSLEIRNKDTIGKDTY